MAIIKNRVARTSYGTNAKVRRGAGWGGKDSYHPSIGDAVGGYRKIAYPGASKYTPHHGARECLRRRCGSTAAAQFAATLGA